MDFGSFFEKIKQEDAEKEAEQKKRKVTILEQEYKIVTEAISAARKDGKRSVQIRMVSEETLKSLKQHAKKIEPRTSMNPSSHDNYVCGYTIYY